MGGLCPDPVKSRVSTALPCSLSHDFRLQAFDALRGWQRPVRLPRAGPLPQAAGRRATGHRRAGAACALGVERQRARCERARQAGGAAALRRPVPRGRRRRARRRDAAAGHRVALGEQGHRHRAQLRAGHPPCRARHRIPLDPEERPTRRSQGAERCATPGLRGAAARPHDRERRLRARGRGAPVRRAAGPAGGACRCAGRRAQRTGRREQGLRPGTVGRRDRLLGRCLHDAEAQPERCGTHDVRAGQQRALPAQDLQRDVHHRWPGAAAVDVRHDPQHREAVAAAHGGGLQRQRRGDGRRPGRALAA